MRRRTLFLVTGVGVLVATALATAAPVTDFATSTRWSTQYGTSGDDRASGVAVSTSGDVYAVSTTPGAYPGNVSGSGNDAVIAKFKSTGVPVWLVQLGISGVHVVPAGIAVARSGDVYIAGTTGGAFPGFVNAAGDDLFVAKYSKSGTLKWVRQLGHADDIETTGVAVSSSGDVYATGTTRAALTGPFLGGFSDGFVVKYNSSGVLKWVRQFGSTDEDTANAVSTSSSGDVYVTGHTWGHLPGFVNPDEGNTSDGYLISFDKNGNLRWQRQFGSAQDESFYGVAVGKTPDVFVAGYTDGAMGASNPGDSDVVVLKFHKNAGAPLWTTQFGTDASDSVTGMATNKSGHPFVSGDTNGAFDGFASAGSQDGFMAHLDTAGGVIVVRQWGVAGTEEATGVAILKSGDPVVAGYAPGALTGLANAGDNDPYLLALPPS